LKLQNVSGRGFTGCGKLRFSGKMSEKQFSGAEARVVFIGFMRGLKPPPPSVSSFSAACSFVPKAQQNNAGLQPPRYCFQLRVILQRLKPESELDLVRHD
jgi:hypothetical protein